MRFYVRYAETDAMTIAHHSNYLVWFEMGRVAWMKEHGMDYRDLEAKGFSLAVSHASLDYKNSAKFDDELEVLTWLTEARSRRLSFYYQIYRLHDRLVVAQGETVHIPLAPGGKVSRLPQDLLSALSPLVCQPSGS